MPEDQPAERDPLVLRTVQSVIDYSLAVLCFLYVGETVRRALLPFLEALQFLLNPLLIFRFAILAFFSFRHDSQKKQSQAALSLEPTELISSAVGCVDSNSKHISSNLGIPASVTGRGSAKGRAMGKRPITNNGAMMLMLMMRMVMTMMIMMKMISSPPLLVPSTFSPSLSPLLDLPLPYYCFVVTGWVAMRAADARLIWQPKNNHVVQNQTLK